MTVNFYARLRFKAFYLLLYASIVRSSFAPKGVRFFEPKWAKKELLQGQRGPAGAVFVEISRKTGIIGLKTRKMPDLPGRQIRHLSWRRVQDSNPRGVAP
jgi:hypothetical protein